MKSFDEKYALDYFRGLYNMKSVSYVPSTSLLGLLLPSEPEQEAPPVEIVPALHDDRQITVWYQGKLYGLVKTGGAGLFACEFMSEGIVAPNAWEL